MHVASIRPVGVAPLATPPAQQQLDALRGELANPFAFATGASCPWGKPEPKPQPKG